jgi:hypothetical protein
MLKHLAGILKKTRHSEFIAMPGRIDAFMS